MDTIFVNTLGTNRVYQYHTRAWKEEMGLYRD